MSYEDVVNQELIKRIQEILKDWRNGGYYDDCAGALYDIETEVHEAVGEE